MLSRFIEYVKEQEKLNKKLPTFKNAKHTLFQMYPYFFMVKMEEILDIIIHLQSKRLKKKFYKRINQ